MVSAKSKADASAVAEAGFVRKDGSGNMFGWAFGKSLPGRAVRVGKE
jgi:hypothetical protein